jgi:hypothetical protein
VLTGMSVARALAFAADEADAALIALGATDRCGMGRVVPGATADTVIQARARWRSRRPGARSALSRSG